MDIILSLINLKSDSNQVFRWLLCYLCEYQTGCAIFKGTEKV